MAGASTGRDRLRVLVYETIHQVGLALLSGTADLVFAPDFTEATAIALVQDVDAMIVRGPVNITARVMDAGARLKVIGRGCATLLWC